MPALSSVAFPKRQGCRHGFPFKSFFALKGCFPFSIGFRGIPGQLGIGLQFNEKYLSSKQGSMHKETFENEANSCSNFPALENLYPKNEVLGLSVKIAKFATDFQHSADCLSVFGEDKIPQVHKVSYKLCLSGTIYVMA